MRISNRNKLTDQLVTQRAQQLSARLAAACSGRENHADLFSVKAIRVGHQLVSLTWEDAFNGERDGLGVLEDREIVPVVRAIFAQLRTWRERCAGQSALSLKAKGVGA